MNTTELQKIKQRYSIVGNDDGLNRALDVALQVAPTDLSVLIVGESGVGKEIIPRIIHDNSPRRREKYFAINCGSIPEGTIDSELFGHEKGSFTGAVGESEGYFGIANRGTIFLDEVGELPQATQARLLRVLETGEYIRVGGTEIRKTDVRIVAESPARGTLPRRPLLPAEHHSHTDAAAAQPRSRHYSALPALRHADGREIPPAENHALRGGQGAHDALQVAGKRAPAEEHHRTDVGAQPAKGNHAGASGTVHSRGPGKHSARGDTVADEQPLLRKRAPSQTSNHSYESERELLYKILYELRGNVSDLRRELNNVRKQMQEVRDLNGAVGFTGAIPTVTTDQMPQRYEPEAAAKTNIHGHVEDAIAEEISEPETLNLNDLGRQMLAKALERNNGNRKKAAQELGISDRTLYRRLKQYGLDK